MLRYYLDLDGNDKVGLNAEAVQANRTRAEFSLQVLADGVGVPARPVQDAANADLVYSADHSRDVAASSDAIRISRFDGNWDDASPVVRWQDDIPLFDGEHGSDTDIGDILHGTYLLTTGAVEKSQERNKFGVPQARGSQLYKAGVFQQPVVGMYVRWLSERMSTLR